MAIVSARNFIFSSFSAMSVRSCQNVLSYIVSADHLILTVENCILYKNTKEYKWNNFFKIIELLPWTIELTKDVFVFVSMPLYTILLVKKY